MTPLRDHLLDAYGGFADRRYKDPALDRAIKVDDRDATDVYPYFCSIFVAVPDRTGEALRLTLQHAPTRPRPRIGSPRIQGLSEGERGHDGGIKPTRPR